MQFIKTTILNPYMLRMACLVTILTISCKENNGTESYKYYQGISQYMKEIHKVDLSKVEDKMYYILPLSDCSSCQGTLLNLEFLSSVKEVKENVTVIIIGSTKILNYKNLIKKSSTNFTFLKDVDNTIISYQTGLGKPMLLHIKKGKVKYYMKITDFRIQDALEYINSNS